MFDRHPPSHSSGIFRSWTAALVLTAILQSGCSTPKPRPHAQQPAILLIPSPDKGVRRSVPPVAIPQPETSNVTPPRVEKPTAPDPQAQALRNLLPRSCVVVEMTPASLLVKSDKPSAPVSLFEEAITLSKLRGLLSAKSSIPKSGVQKTVLRNGTAELTFTKSVPPADAAAAIVAALSLDGVQRVRAQLEAD